MNILNFNILLESRSSQGKNKCNFVTVFSEEFNVAAITQL